MAMAPPESAELPVKVEDSIVPLDFDTMATAPPKPLAELFRNSHALKSIDDGSTGCGYFCADPEAHKAPPDDADVQATKDVVEIWAFEPTIATAPPFPCPMWKQHMTCQKMEVVFAKCILQARNNMTS